MSRRVVTQKNILITALTAIEPLCFAFAAGTLLGRFLPLAKRSALDETHSPDWPLHAICATAGNYFPAGLAKSEPASLGLFYRARIIPPDWKRSQKLAPKVCDMTFGDSCPFR